MVILGIETSCDETSAAVVRRDGKGRFRMLSNVVSSQIDLHREYAGVVPELASRAHLERLPSVLDSAVTRAFGRRAKLSKLRGKVDAVAYTRGPGLAGALLVGKVTAEALARAQGLPLVGVNHLEGHALAMGLEGTMEFPSFCLIVSGGHTELVLVRAPGRYRVLGRTRDDAAGEVFDKVAKFLRLGYPGGPAVDREAGKGDPRKIPFPRPLLPGTWDFSFSGLKTAVLYRVRDAGYAGEDRVRPAVPVGRRIPARFLADICASFQEAVVDTLVEKTAAAAARSRVPRVSVGGGVAANGRLRESLRARGRRDGFSVHFPPRGLCTDNAAMIALAGACRFAAGRGAGPRRVDPSLRLRSWS